MNFRRTLSGLGAALLVFSASPVAAQSISLMPRDGGRTQIAGLTFESVLQQLQVEASWNVEEGESDVFCSMMIFDSEGEVYDQFAGERVDLVSIRDPGQSVFACRTPGEFLPGDMFRPRDQLLPPRMSLNEDFMLGEQEWDSFALAEELRFATPQFDRFVDEAGDPGVDARWIAVMIVITPEQGRWEESGGLQEVRPLTVLLSGEAREFRRGR